jgi:hypothetical protein
MKYVLSVFCLFLVSFCHSQELGYLSGANKIGVSPARFQPLYGFTIGAKINKYLAIETALFYSQRSIGETIQADYFTFMAMPKIGYFGKRAGLYYAPAIALNPTLHHSSIENHTYISTIQAVGGQLNLGSKVIVDAKAGYDMGLSGAYLPQNGEGGFKKYSGLIVFVGLKFKFNDED